MPCRCGATPDARSRDLLKEIAKRGAFSIQDLRLSRRRPRVRVPSTPPTFSDSFQKSRVRASVLARHTPPEAVNFRVADRVAAARFPAKKAVALASATFT